VRLWTVSGAIVLALLAAAVIISAWPLPWFD
jgi:hypothetical protein